ncbi:FIVAR domain-containing protein [Thermophilibacter immobilis]|uniref:beta-N-acetylhexosaminidase n=1 Tax=Thermophilibacter immobilis TaxID=2779519 RepID=A0A7S7M8D2_9ACTN|nr:FIVAR domain-containing protein [Thermophilibacter immobilis]
MTCTPSPQTSSPSINRRTFLKAGAAGLAVAAGLGLAPLPAFAEGAQGSGNTDVEAVLAGMSRRQKIAQKLMPDFRKWAQDGTVADFTVMNAEVAGIVDKYDFSGVILFANNVKETEQTLRLCRGLQDAVVGNASGNSFGDVPLLLTIDQEGGIVYRLGSGTGLPGNMAVGATRSVEDARDCGEVIGRELSALGINVNFAPVLDVNSNPNNPVIGLRSIGSKPELVSELGVPMMQGVQAHNVAVSAKHFPGHGDAGTDSHTGLPRIEKTQEELEAVDFAPFKAAIKAGADMLMTAHIQYPKVETGTATSTNPDTGEIELPATLSHIFMTDILRTEMGFTGVSVTDALNMMAIASNFDYIDAVRRTFLAGVDIALMPLSLTSSDDLPRLDALIDTLEQDSSITDAYLDESVRRILALKKKRGILDYASTAGDIDAALSETLATVGSAENRSVEREVSADAVTVVKNEGGVLPLCPSSGDHVLLVAAYQNERPGMELAMRRLIAEGKIPEDVTYKSIDYAETYGDPALALEAILPEVSEATQVVVISEVGRTSNLNPQLKSVYSTYIPTQIAIKANEAKVPVAIMSISLPYDCAVYEDAPAVAAVFGNMGMDPTEALAPATAFGPNIPAGIEVLMGGHGAQGKLPVDLYDAVVDDNGAHFNIESIAYPFGFGLEYDPCGEKTTVDTTALAATVKDIEDNVVPKKDTFTAESFAALQSALDAAKAVLDDPDATQEQVDQALKELTDARGALVTAGGSPEPGTNPHPTPDTDANDKKTPKGKVPNTGDPSPLAALAAAAVAGAAAIGAGRAIGANDAKDDGE